MIKEAEHKFTIVNHLGYGGTWDNKVFRLSTPRKWGITILFIIFRSCISCYSCLFGFLIGRIGALQGLGQGTNNPWEIKDLTVGVSLCIASSFNGYWRNFGKGSVESIWIFIGSALLVFSMSIDKVAKRVWGSSDNSGVSLGHSSSAFSIANCRACSNSDSGWLGNSRVISLLGVKFVLL